MTPAIETLGFVGIDEIQNIITHELKAIEEDITINGFPADPKICIEWIDAIRLRLLQRAKYNINEYIKQNPLVKREAREAKEAEATKGKDPKETWQEKVKAARQEAIKECYKV